jgi:hypothetical protein
MSVMTCRVINPFVARPPFPPDRPKVFHPGDVLENVDYASGELALFQLSGSGDQTLYQLPVDQFKQFTEVVSF